ncbi:unnamed protein product [Musa acuminata subsp. burmannicoides]
MSPRPSAVWSVYLGVAVRSRRATRVSSGAVLLLFFGLLGKGEGDWWTEMGVHFAAGLMAMAVVAAAVAGSAAQSPPPDCVSNLVGCAGYLNSTTTPPDSCCKPLKQAAKTQLPCLCSLFNNTAILRAFNVNITQAIQMSKRCGVSTDQRACETATASGTTATPSSSNNDTGSSAGKDSSSANRATSIGLPGLVSLLLCWWSLMT